MRLLFSSSAIKDQVMRGFPIRLDGPSQVALFACDNHTCIVESFRPNATDLKISVAGGFTKLKNLRTGEIISGEAGRPGIGRQPEAGATLAGFNVHLPPHSYAVFAAENQPLWAFRNAPQSNLSSKQVTVAPVIFVYCRRTGVIILRCIHPKIA
jgi:hypothetical protein